MNHPLPIINYPLSTIHYQLSIINYPLSIITLLLLMSLYPITSTAQSFQWLQNGGSNNTLTGNFYHSKEQIIDMVTDSQRNTYILAVVGKDNVYINPYTNPIAISTYEQNPHRTDIILVSYSCDGSYRWHKILGGGGGIVPQG